MRTKMRRFQGRGVLNAKRIFKYDKAFADKKKLVENKNEKNNQSRNNNNV